MKYHVKTISCLFLSILLAGCSGAGNLLSGSKDTNPNLIEVPVDNALMLPPDLEKENPGAVITEEQLAAYEASKKSGNGFSFSLNDILPTGKTIPANSDLNLLKKYNISTLRPDGSKKTLDELVAEVREAKRKDRQATNPEWGTIKNFGNLFKN